MRTRSKVPEELAKEIPAIAWLVQLSQRFVPESQDGFNEQFCAFLGAQPICETVNPDGLMAVLDVVPLLQVCNPHDLDWRISQLQARAASTKKALAKWSR